MDDIALDARAKLGQMTPMQTLVIALFSKGTGFNRFRKSFLHLSNICSVTLIIGAEHSPLRWLRR
jgi:hypothetical protein